MICNNILGFLSWAIYIQQCRIRIFRLNSIFRKFAPHVMRRIYCWDVYMYAYIYAYICIYIYIYIAYKIDYKRRKIRNSSISEWIWIYFWINVARSNFRHPRQCVKTCPVYTSLTCTCQLTHCDLDIKLLFRKIL